MVLIYRIYWQRSNSTKIVKSVFQKRSHEIRFLICSVVYEVRSNMRQTKMFKVNLWKKSHEIRSISWFVVSIKHCQVEDNHFKIFKNSLWKEAQKDWTHFKYTILFRSKAFSQPQCCLAFLGIHLRMLPRCFLF